MALWNPIVPNAGFETGDISNWTPDVNTPVIQTGAPHTGTYYVRLANLSGHSDGAYYQDISIPAETKTFVAKGAVTLNPSAWFTDYSGDTDTQRFTVKVLNAAGEYIQVWIENSGPFTNDRDDTWEISSFEVPLHKDADSIRLYAEGIRVTGTELSCYQDDWALAANSTGVYRYDPPFVNLNAADGVTGWTVSSGSMAAKSGKASGVNLNPVGSLHFYGAATAAFYSTQNVTLPISYGLDTALDTGSVGFFIDYIQFSFNGLDRGGVGVRFYDISDVEVGSFGHVTSAANKYGRQRFFSGAVPADTRKMELVISGIRASGSNLDCNLGPIQAYFLVNSNFLDGDNSPSWPQPPIGARGFPVATGRGFPDTRYRVFPLI